MEKSKFKTQRGSIILPDEDFPLFDLERRKLKWASTRAKAKKSLLWIAIPPIITLIVLWFIFIYRDSLEYRSYGNWVIVYMYVIFVGTLTLLSGLLDFASMVVTFSSMRNEQVFNRLDLLALATEKENITRSKHAFAKLRIARFLVFNLAVRLAVLLMLGLAFILGNYFFNYSLSWSEMWQNLVYDIREYPLGAMGIGIGGTLVLAFYLIEPIWRVNAITAMGIALSARIKSIALLAPMAFFVLALMWILQALIIAGFGFGIAWTSERFYNWYWDWRQTNYPDYPRPDFVNSLDDWFAFTGLFLALILFIFVANRFYRILKGIAYGRIYARIP